MRPEIVTLSELQYSTDIHGPLKLYLYDRNGFHRGGQWFARRIRYPEEEIPLDLAQAAAEAWTGRGLEVRITNGTDFLVYHAKDGKMIYPANAAEFWEKACR